MATWRQAQQPDQRDQSDTDWSAERDGDTTLVAVLKRTGDPNGG